MVMFVVFLGNFLGHFFLFASSRITYPLWQSLGLIDMYLEGNLWILVIHATVSVVFLYFINRPLRRMYKTLDKAIRAPLSRIRKIEEQSQS